MQINLHKTAIFLINLSNILIFLQFILQKYTSIIVIDVYLREFVRYIFRQIVEGESSDLTPRHSKTLRNDFAHPRYSRPLPHLPARGGRLCSSYLFARKMRFYNGLLYKVRYHNRNLLLCTKLVADNKFSSNIKI